jgi:hypothetical protein
MRWSGRPRRRLPAEFRPANKIVDLKRILDETSP